MAAHHQYFREVVDNIFNRWSALQLAVVHGMGGFNGHEKAMQLMEEVYTYCIQNEMKLDRDDLCDLLEAALDEDFSTICEDNSTREISMLFVRYLKMCRENKLAEIEAELSQLPPLKERWLQPGHVVQYQNQMEDSSSDEDEEEMTGNRLANGFTVKDATGDSMEPSHSGSTMEFVEEEDPGWTVVKQKGNRRK